MRTLLVCSAILAFEAALAPAVRACDTVEKATPDSTCVVMSHEGRAGVWFVLTQADELRKYSLEVPELRLQVGALEERAKLRDYQVDTYRTVIDLKDSALKTADAAMAASAREARDARTEAAEARADLNAWYRSPLLWAALGAVTVGAVWLASR